MGESNFKKPSAKPIFIAIGFFVVILVSFITYRESYSIDKQLKMFEGNLISELEDALELEVLLKHDTFIQKHDEYTQLFHTQYSDTIDFIKSYKALDNAVDDAQLMRMILALNEHLGEFLTLVIYDADYRCFLVDDSLLIEPIEVHSKIIHTIENTFDDPQQNHQSSLIAYERFNVGLVLDNEHLILSAKQRAIDEIVASYINTEEQIFIINRETYVYHHPIKHFNGHTVYTIHDAIFIQAAQHLQNLLDQGQTKGHTHYDFYADFDELIVSDHKVYYVYHEETNLIFGKSYPTTYFSPLIDTYRAESRQDFFLVILPIYFLLTLVALAILKLIFDYAKKATQTMESEEKLYLKISELTSQMIVITDLKGQVLYGNDTTKKIMLHQSQLDTIPFHQRFQKEKDYTVFHAPNHKKYYVQVKKETIDYHQQEAYLYYLEDVTDVIKRKLSLEQEILKDNLTGLYNRKALLQRFNALIKNQKKGKLAIIDLDGFKEINDLYGHDEGDKILAHIAKVFTDFSTDTMNFYRVGGDEFALLSVDHSVQIDKYLKQVNKALRHIKMNGISPHFSYGYTTIKPDYHDSFSYYYKKADQRLYKQKNTRAEQH